MQQKRDNWLVGLTIVASLVLAACGTTPTAPAATSAPAAATSAPAAAATTAPAAPVQPASTGEYTIGMVLVGPPNDGGWNQSHYEAAQYVLQKQPGTKFVYIDKVNQGDRPNVKVEQAIEELIGKGAKFIITNSAEFADGTNEAAKANPEVIFIHASGDSVLTGKAPANVGNIMGRMEYGKMISGCAAALSTETGKIGYVGPLIDNETRRLVNSAYLGAKHCWEKVRGKPAGELQFKVTWIGFWFNIPGVTLDPTKVAQEFISTDHDVLMSGIDTTEALVEANKATEGGKKVLALPYDFKGACAQAESVCLGVPWYNWGPAYNTAVQAAREGTWKQAWEWNGPNWSNMNDIDTSAVGFSFGQALSADNKTKLEAFIAQLADGSLNLFVGPLKYQDGTEYLKEGEVADDSKIWNTTQLLEGVDGQSVPTQ
jgi:simple sugar transport system substrate-binding protein